jgi:hypothetical protein
MNGYQLFHTFRLLLFVLLFVLGGLIIVGTEIYKEITIEAQCQRQFGQDWKQQYESHYGPNSLSEAHTKMLIGIVAIPVILIIVWLISREVAGRNQLSRSSSRRRRRR